MMIQDIPERKGGSPPWQTRRRTYHHHGGQLSSGAGPSSSYQSQYSFEGLYGLIEQFQTHTSASFDWLTGQIAASNAPRAPDYAQTMQEINRLGERMDKQWGPFEPNMGNWRVATLVGLVWVWIRVVVLLWHYYALFNNWHSVNYLFECLVGYLLWPWVLRHFIRYLLSWCG